MAEASLELLARYDVAGPRYTSYPTAPCFSADFTAADYLDELKRIGQAASCPPLSLYFHLPFCGSVCFFCACNVAFTTDHRRPDRYLDRMIREMDAVLSVWTARRLVKQMHWGGGTPTFFSPDQMSRLYEAVAERFSIQIGAEVALEVDPRQTSREQLRLLGRLGFNRISVGIQDFDPRVQAAVRRVQSEDLTRKIIDEARAEGFKSVSVDLIYGLPFQEEASFARTLDRVLTLSPDRVAVFNFAYLPGSVRRQKAVPREGLPSPSEKLRLLQRAIRTFAGAGFRYIGMDHFARPGDELCVAQDRGTLGRNFQGYTSHAGCELLAFGASSISQAGGVYAQNQRDVRDYERVVDAGGVPTMRGIRLSAEDELRRDVIMRLMCHLCLEKKAVEQRHGICFDTHFADALDALAPMERDGMVRCRRDRLEVTPLGRLFIRNLCLPFDAYFRRPAKGGFSRTV